MQSISVGIIGYGRIGAEHAGWIEASGTARVGGVVDATPARAQKAVAAGLRLYPNLASMLNDSSIDAILVASPTAMHFEHASQAIGGGKHVMIEKPMALDLPQAAALAKDARQQQRVLSVFHNRRWDIDYLSVRDAIASGVFGKLINIESRLGQFASCVGPAAREYRPGWRNEASYGGGGLYDWGSHFIDQMQLLLRPARPIRVFAQLRANVWSQDCDDFARVLIDFDNGVAALVEINTTTTLPLARWQIEGTAGAASSPPSPTFDTNQWAQLRFVSADPHGQSRLLPKAADRLTESQIWQQFAAAVRGHSEPAVPVETVLPTMLLLDAARESARTGRCIDLSETNPNA